MQIQIENTDSDNAKCADEAVQETPSSTADLQQPPAEIVEQKEPQNENPEIQIIATQPEILNQGSKVKPNIKESVKQDVGDTHGHHVATGESEGLAATKCNKQECSDTEPGVTNITGEGSLKVKPITSGRWPI